MKERATIVEKMVSRETLLIYCKQGCSDTRPSVLTAHLIDLHARPTRKYSIIFEHIRVYSRYFKRILREYV